MRSPATKCTSMNCTYVAPVTAIAEQTLSAANSTFKRFYFNSIPTGYASGDVVVVSAISSNECSCAGNYTVQSVHTEANYLVVVETFAAYCSATDCLLQRFLVTESCTNPWNQSVCDAVDLDPVGGKCAAAGASPTLRPLHQFQSLAMPVPRRLARHCLCRVRRQHA